jgi:bifunctional non-homologous end joining protein LigD
MADRLKTYREKRDFRKTAEPSGSDAPGRGARAKPGRAGGLRYLIQKHDATRLHFDFRLEHEGVLLSWAVTRGPSYDPKDKRLAVHVEDHPLAYGDFEGTIPEGNYGGGTVMLWDEGTWEPVGDVYEGLAKGDLKFTLHGERLKGKWVLVRMKHNRDKRSKADNWLLIKERDEYAGPEKKPIIERAMTSVRSGRTMEEIAEGNLEWVKGARLKADAPKKPAGRKTARGKTGGKVGAKLDPPKFVAPQLATLAEAPPDGDGWLHEMKFDGYRVIAAIGGGRAITYTRTGLDWTDKFRGIVQPLADLPCRSALIDGEAVVLDENGKSDFGRLQNAIAEGKDGIVYYAFDLLWLDGVDLRKEALTERKKKLAALLADEPAAGPLFYSDHVLGNGAETFERACSMKLEGIVSKRADAPYRSERTKSWLKVKCGNGQELVIIGWQPSTVKTRPFSSLLVATREGNKFRYRGKVGTGYGERELTAVWKELAKRPAKEPAADDVPRDIRRKSKFVTPDLVAEVSFAGWTEEGYVRHGAFKGLRTDKKAADVHREAAKEIDAKAETGTRKESAVIAVTDEKLTSSIDVGGIRVTHPDRVVYKEPRTTKRGLIDYYRAVAKLMLPHVVKRPLSIVRCPQGAHGDCFFQKHASAGFPEAFRPITITEKETKGEYLYIEDEKGLVAAVQMGVLELHIWGAHNATLEKPDRLVFDFDPDEDVPFGAVKDAAKAMRERLKSLGLTSFVMATGGKGLHVVVPLTPKHGWEDFKAFAEAMARTFAAENPDRFLAEASKARRKGKIYVDYLRNGRGATAIAPYSTRARKGAPVAWPLAWTDLPKLASAHEVTVANAASILMKRRSDPWKDYFSVRQTLPLDTLR